MTPQPNNTRKVFAVLEDMEGREAFFTAHKLPMMLIYFPKRT